MQRQAGCPGHVAAASPPQAVRAASRGACRGGHGLSSAPACSHLARRCGRRHAGPWRGHPARSFWSNRMPAPRGLGGAPGGGRRFSDSLAAGDEAVFGMRIDIVTLFPEVALAPLSDSIIQRARAAGIVEVRAHQLRDWSLDKHRRVDASPCGGGPGMASRKCQGPWIQGSQPFPPKHWPG